MSADLLCLGITHASAPLAVRETLRPSLEQQRAMLDRLAPLAAGRLVLSTCERFELYAMTNQADVNLWHECVADWFHLPLRLVRSHSSVLRGSAAAEHLLRVAAGLESRILGEPQILGQVRDAYRCTLEEQAADPLLAALGRTAIRTGRRVRHETTINQGRVSIATAALDWLECSSGPLSNQRIAVVGTGSLALDVVHELAARGAARVAVVGRNAERAALLARAVRGTASGLGSLTSSVAEADAVITCTSAPSYLLDAATIAGRGARPIVIADLAVPRNVDPAVAVLPGVRLAHLDDLASGLARDHDGIPAAARIVAEELAAFDRWRKERRAVPTIIRLLSEAESAARTGSTVSMRELHQSIVRAKAEVAA